LSPSARAAEEKEQAKQDGKADYANNHHNHLHFQ
jgi:hypothetical protein